MFLLGKNLHRYLRCLTSLLMTWFSLLFSSLTRLAYLSYFFSFLARIFIQVFFRQALLTAVQQLLQLFKCRWSSLYGGEIVYAVCVEPLCPEGCSTKARIDLRAVTAVCVAGVTEKKRYDVVGITRALEQVI